MFFGLMEFLFDRVIMLPLSATYDSRYKAVRVLGVMALFIWFFPVMMVCIIPLLILMLCTLIEEA